MHLGNRAYELLQDFVHRDHSATVARMERLLEMRPGSTVIEIGCGTGCLARHLVERGYQYCGIDPDPDRIEAARRAGAGNFVVGDALILDDLEIEQRYFVIHGVLHHLSDFEARRVLQRILRNAGARVVITEPVRPDRWWRNPAGAFFAAMDEGRYVRTLAQWQALFGAAMDYSSLRSLWPRWPVPMLDARLVSSAGANQSGVAARMQRERVAE